VQRCASLEGVIELDDGEKDRSMSGMMDMTWELGSARTPKSTNRYECVRTDKWAKAKTKSPRKERSNPGCGVVTFGGRACKANW
jgi:hypothetical protein